MMSYQEGSHIMRLRVIWPTEEIKPDLAVENAKMFFIGRAIVLSPDGKIQCSEVSGLKMKSFDYLMDLSIHSNSFFLTSFRELMDLENGRFKIKDMTKADNIFVYTFCPFGDKLLIIDRDGFLSVAPEDKEFDQMENILIT